MAKVRNEHIGVLGNVVAVLKDENDREIYRQEAHNIVTNDGDVYYAQKAVGETPTDDFTAGGMRLGSGTTTPVKANTDVTTFITSATVAEETGYPKTNDTDADNTGGGTDNVTWKFIFTAASFNSSGIAEGAIVDNTTTPTAALSHFLFAAAFTKSASNKLIVFVNHTFNGV
jgi:hypothetical protein